MTDDANDAVTANFDLDDTLKRDELARDEAWRLLIAVLKTVGGRVTIKRELLQSIDIATEEVRFGPSTDDEVSLQVGNGLRG
ncbi:hypothetical protein [Hyphomicrobium sp.]|uniref:hypothetical protein n=1 Tax=Hyphomicrobium sp. TaxID=82 RepID=UPI001D47E107|nr:hypothetical protein [Hyphomicrobium sp.]MBY0561430.1 hypothetical protein [Hyphomicrobium sp.]